MPVFLMFIMFLVFIWCSSLWIAVDTIVDRQPWSQIWIYSPS